MWRAGQPKIFSVYLADEKESKDMNPPFKSDRLPGFDNRPRFHCFRICHFH